MGGQRRIAMGLGLGFALGLFLRYILENPSQITGVLGLIFDNLGLTAILVFAPIIVSTIVFSSHVAMIILTLKAVLRRVDSGCITDVMAGYGAAGILIDLARFLATILAQQ